MKKYIKLIFMTMILFMVVGISNGSWNGYITVAPYGPQACEDYFTGFVYASVDEDFQQTSWVGYMEYAFLFYDLPDNGSAYGNVSTWLLTEPNQYCDDEHNVSWTSPPAGGEVIIHLGLTIHN